MGDVVAPLRGRLEPEVFFAIFGGMIALFVALWIFDRKREEARRRALGDWARARGHRLVIDAPTEAPSFRWPFFASGRSRRVASVFEGEASPGGPRFRVFRFSYVTGGGKHRRTHRYVCAMTAEDPAFDRAPSFQTRPRHLGDVIGGWFGGGGVRHPEDDEFSDALRLDAEDEPAATRFFDRALRDAWRAEAGPDAAGFAAGSTFVARKGAGEPAEYDAAIRSVLRLQDAVHARRRR